MIFDVLFDPLWAIVIGIEKVANQENMHHWEVCPEKGTPHDLNVVAVPKSFLIV